jgi:hypothetical protein
MLGDGERVLWRASTMTRWIPPQMGFFDDKVGPITVAVLVLLTLVTIFIIALLDYFY